MPPSTVQVAVWSKQIGAIRTALKLSVDALVSPEERVEGNARSSNLQLNRPLEMMPTPFRFLTFRGVSHILPAQ